MTVYDYLRKHPESPVRIVRYTPAPDTVDEYGDPHCTDEGTSAVIFDSTASGDFPPDLLFVYITAINEGDDGIPELEYIPDECC